jgi:hypothetical protein
MRGPSTSSKIKVSKKIKDFMKKKAGDQFSGSDRFRHLPHSPFSNILYRKIGGDRQV